MVGGIKSKVYNEGTHFRIPIIEVLYLIIYLIIQKPYIYDIRTKVRNVSSSTGTQDLQKVNIKLRLLTHPTVEDLPEIHRTLGKDYEERVFVSLCNEVLKIVVAKYLKIYFIDVMLKNY